MGLDICRFVEVRDKDGKWERIKLGLDDGKKSRYASHFGYGRTISEILLDDEEFEHYFNIGVPNDSQEVDKQIYKEWGYKTKWINLDDFYELISSYEEKLFNEIKAEKYKENNNISQKLDEILAALGKEINKNEPEEEFYPEYQWGDKKITNKFEDKLAIGLYNINIIAKEPYAANAIVEMTINGYVPFRDIRIIYVYNN